MRNYLCIYAHMENSLDIRLRADRAFVEYLCAITGETASAIAREAGMAPTTLNRYLSKKVKLTSTLKDSTIQKIAEKWGFDYLELMIYRKRIEEALRQGKAIPDIRKNRFKPLATRVAGFKEPGASPMATSERDPLMDQIMGATYEVWFNSPYRETVEFDRLPGFVRLLYSRTRAEKKSPTVAETKKRAADMLAVASMEGKKKKL